MSKKKDKEAKVYQIIGDLTGLAPDNIEPWSNLKDDLDMDELDLVEMAMCLEEEFDTDIPEEKLNEFRTVQDVVDFIEDLA
jgi:acyl carrier protein